MEENQVSPTGNSPESVEPIPPTEPRASFESENLAPEPESPVPEPENISPEPVSPDPAQTFEANNFPEPAPKKKKTGLLLLIIILVLLIAGVIVAILFLTKKPEQDVKAASSKFLDALTAIMTSEATDVKNKNLKIDGNIEITIPSSQYAQGMGANLGIILEANDYSDARVVFNVDGSVGMPITFSLEGRKISRDSNYLKINGIIDIISSFLTSNMSRSGNNNQTQRLLDVLSGLDDSWLEINTEELREYMEKITEEAQAAHGVNSYSIASTQDSLCVTSNMNYDEIISRFDLKEIEKALLFEPYNYNNFFME